MFLHEEQGFALLLSLQGKLYYSQSNMVVNKEGEQNGALTPFCLGCVSEMYIFYTFTSSSTFFQFIYICTSNVFVLLCKYLYLMSCLFRLSFHRDCCVTGNGFM